ncbi:hypothetical protein DEO72_LG10g2057 [Vigna unguiculata]|uniref:Uncharacterized protein n=1 Tax=Vigna unguiculata TaxID=3917 RepID=A0A4D6NF63_VIGUN|nr:hypothetical protein DEO72_LG10g2057 [Vigna unguiculata]
MWKSSTFKIGQPEQATRHPYRQQSFRPPQSSPAPAAAVRTYTTTINDARTIVPPWKREPTLVAPALVRNFSPRSYNTHPWRNSSRSATKTNQICEPPAFYSHAPGPVAASIFNLHLHGSTVFISMHLLQFHFHLHHASAMMPQITQRIQPSHRSINYTVFRPYHAVATTTNLQLAGNTTPSRATSQQRLQ